MCADEGYQLGNGLSELGRVLARGSQGVRAVTVGEVNRFLRALRESSTRNRRISRWALARGSVAQPPSGTAG